MPSTDIEEEEFTTECDAVQKYREQLIHFLVTYRSILEKETERGTPSTQGTSSDNVSKMKFRLPKMQFKHFDGDVRNWLRFRGQFMNKIHKDEEIDNEDKFLYLLQATEHGSAA